MADITYSAQDVELVDQETGIKADIVSTASGGVQLIQQVNELPGGTRYIGLVTAYPVGVQTLAPSPNFIGLATITQAFTGNTTVYSQIISATGNTTIFVAPASNRFYIKNLHLSSLGKAEVEIRSGATTLIPFTALATTGGYIHNAWGDGWPSRSQADAFVVNLNGAATIAVAVNVRFAS